MMKIEMGFRVLVLSLLVAFLGTACTGINAEPTLDPNVIYTEAAKTVAAQLTAAAPSTNTPQPTPIPTNTPQPPTNTPLPERPTDTPETNGNESTSTPLPEPTVTKSTSSDDLIDSAEMISISPPDDQVYSANGVFTATIGFRNIGPNTWNNEYSLRYLSGNTYGANTKYTIDDFSIKDSVAPGQDVLITIPNMTAPSEPGRYLSNWCLYNNREAQGLKPQCFYLVTFQIIVDNP